MLAPFCRFSAGLPSSVRSRSGQRCSPSRNGRLARPCDRSAYTYTPSGCSPALLVSFSWVPPGFGPKQSRAVHPRELGKHRMRSSLPSGKSATPPARCIHRPQRDTSSAGYRLLVSRASCGASRELSSRRSPALAPHTCAVSPTFRYGAFFFVASALAAVPPARLASCVRNHTSIATQTPTLIDSKYRPYHRRQKTPRQNCRATPSPPISSARRGGARPRLHHHA